jgi:ligand-binding sensor domain-containing protein
VRTLAALLPRRLARIERILEYLSMWLANKFAPLLLALALLSQIALESACFAQEGIYAVRNIRHTSWTSEKGVSAVFEIQQDSNGYLWLNTANGVVRFDGVRFQSLEDATNDALRSSDITAAYIAPSGRIWFTTRTAGLILLENGHAGVYSSDRRCISLAANGGMAEDPFLDLRWNRPEGANRMIKFLRHALKSRAHLD